MATSAHSSARSPLLSFAVARVPDSSRLSSTTNSSSSTASEPSTPSDDDDPLASFMPSKAPRWTPGDFVWTEQEEPHRSRRIAILKAHPEVRRLMGPTSVTAWVVLLVLGIQLAAAYLLRDSSPWSWRFLVTAYVVGGTANQNLFLAVHEITHNLCFKGIAPNRAMAIVANLGVAVPYAMVFKRYHQEHHRYLGEDDLDTDVPTRLEVALLSNTLGKAFFCTFQLLFYAIRPGLVRALPLTPLPWILSNITAQIAFDVAVWYFWGGKALGYLFMSSFWAGSLHPMAGHFIAEHYLWDGWGMETWSYYGWLNWLAYNVGYHNEHHDFPAIPWTRLPELTRIAKEFYDPLPRHESWPMVTLQFIFSGDAGPWARMKRENHQKARERKEAAAKALQASAETVEEEEDRDGGPKGQAAGGMWD